MQRELCSPEIAIVSEEPWDEREESCLYAFYL
jgi:hypothetical protein